MNQEERARLEERQRQKKIRERRRKKQVRRQKMLLAGIIMIIDYNNSRGKYCKK